MGDAKLSFILPVALKEKGKSNSTTAWRHEPDKQVLLRLECLILSFIKMFRQEDLEQMIIISPPEDVETLSALLASSTNDERYVVLSELAVCNDLHHILKSDNSNISGWYVQQLLKLSVASDVKTPFYVTLDSDLLCIRPCCYEDFIVAGKAITGTECLSDYQQLYTSKFSEIELNRKKDRYINSARILNYKRSGLDSNRFYSETPAVLETSLVEALKTSLGDHYSQPWAQILYSQLNWTEYSLYYLFCEMENYVGTRLQLGGCDTVLNLGRSVWQPSSVYLHCREYSASFFFEMIDLDKGPFVAIQSWLPLHSWLPTRYESFEELYREIRSHLYKTLP